MKAGSILAISILSAALVSTGITWWTLATPEDDSSMSANEDLEAALRRSKERITELEEALLDIRASQDRIEKMVGSQNQTVGLVNGLQEELFDIRMELGDLKAEVERVPALGALAAGGEVQGDQLQALLGETLKKAVDDRVRTTARSEQMRAFQPFIRAGFRQEMRRMSKKLKLRDDQKSRFDDTLNQAFDKTMPLVTVMMDTSRAQEERTQAFNDIQTTYDEVNEEASSFLDPEQKKIFDEQQSRSRQDIERFRDMIDSGNMPLFPGAPGGNSGSSPPNR